jgi:acyl-CoA thioesterase-2
MHPLLSDLIDLLSLERTGPHAFRGRSKTFGRGRVFGGLVVGQALGAAQATVPDDRGVHSMHAYFMRPGRGDVPIEYTVDPIRDGRSFHTRRVVAAQGGEAILSLSASFAREEDGMDHHDPMPEAAPPEDLLNTGQLTAKILHLLPPGAREAIMSEWPIETRPVTIVNPMAPQKRPAHRQVWFKALSPLPDDPMLHRCLLAYASDSHFLTTAMQPHGVSWMTQGLQVASLDHAMWFHRSFRLDEWLLYDVRSPSASGARGLVQGRFFDRDGRLVASTTQEGLIRDRR